MDIKEILFWKVYHNTYLNNLIFDRIFTLNFNINLNKTLKYGKVHTLTSMIEDLVTTSPKSSHNRMIILFKFLMGIKSDRLILLNGTWQSKKRILKYLVKTTKSKKLYSLYYFNYYKLINDVGLNGETFERLKSVGILKKLNNADNESILDYIISFLNDIKWSNWKKNTILVNKIIDTVVIITGDNKEIYEKTIESIGKVNPKFQLLFSSFKWNRNLKQVVENEKILHVNNSDIIDWLSTIEIEKNSFCNVRLKYYIKRKNGLVKFINKGLEEYSILKLNENDLDKSLNLKFKSIKWSQILNNPFLSILKNHLEKFDDIISNDQNEVLNIISILKKGKYELKNDELNFEFNLEIINYLPKRIKKELRNNNNNNNNFIDYSNDINQVLLILFESIFKFDFISSKLIYNTLDISTITTDQLNNVLNIVIKKNYHNIEDEIFINEYQEKFIQIINIKPKKMIEFIKFTINYFIENQSKQIIINYLFKKLIQIKGVTMEQVFEIKTLIENNDIQIQHSLYHSFYYLNIKSFEIILNIISLKNSVLIKIRNNLCCGGHCMGKTKYRYKTLFSTKHMIDITKLTFEYIYKQSINELIEYFKWFKNNFLSTTIITERLEIKKL